MPFAERNPRQPRPGIVAMFRLPQQAEIAVGAPNQILAGFIGKCRSRVFECRPPEYPAPWLDDLPDKINTPIYGLKYRLARVEGQAEPFRDEPTYLGGSAVQPFR